MRQGRRIVQAAAVGGEALPRGSLWKHRAPHENTHPAEGSVTVTHTLLLAQGCPWWWQLSEPLISTWAQAEQGAHARKSRS